MRQISFIVLVVFAAFSLALSQTLSPQVRALVKADAPVVALTHVRVIDGTGAPAREDQNGVLVIKGDPSRKIEDIENAEIAFKGGVGYDSAKLIESVRGTVGSR
jgi:hypothetical protein